MSLWLPIVASAALVWFASAIVWMAMPWHKSDYAAVPDEEAARQALRGIAPGNYMLPYCVDPKDIEKPELRQKFEEGPQAYLTVAPNGVPKMAGKLVSSYAYNLLVGGLCAYMVSRTVVNTGDYLEVFRVAGTVAFIAYGIAYVQDSIWFSRPWSLTAKSFLDALIYGLLTGGVFGWLVAGG